MPNNDPNNRGAVQGGLCSRGSLRFPRVPMQTLLPQRGSRADADEEEKAAAGRFGPRLFRCWLWTCARCEWSPSLAGRPASLERLPRPACCKRYLISPFSKYSSNGVSSIIVDYCTSNRYSTCLLFVRYPPPPSISYHSSSSSMVGNPEEEGLISDAISLWAFLLFHSHWRQWLLSPSLAFLNRKHNKSGGGG